MTQQQPVPASAIGAEYAEKLRRSYLNFRWPLFLLEPDEHSRPCLENGWTPIASVAHIAFWDRFQLQRMQAALGHRQKPPIVQTVATNDEMAANENRNWDTVLNEADEARRDLINLALSLTSEQIEAEYMDRGNRTPVVKNLLERMPEHVDEHAEDVHRYCFSLERWGRDRLLTFYRRHFNSLLDAITGLTETGCTSVPVLRRLDRARPPRPYSRLGRVHPGARQTLARYLFTLQPVASYGQPGTWRRRRSRPMDQRRC